MKTEQFFRNKVKEYYTRFGRDFFWRSGNLTPYQIMITELFLKKTRAENVEKHVFGFLKEFPTYKKILQCKKSTLYRKVQGLGLGRQRTVALKEIAIYVNKKFSGRLPEDINKISEIPHVGPYIANATMCFGLNKRSPILDINTSRIISRFFGLNNDVDLRNNSELQDKASEVLPRRRFKEYNWGLLDLGSSTCKANPLCQNCLLKIHCNYYRQHSLEYKQSTKKGLKKRVL
jgi:A/G-specific adenine glycosylase